MFAALLALLFGLLRCIAGLIAPSSGTVLYRGTPLNGANPGVAMVFQSFALLPWLTVQQNVELAMQARDVPEAQRARHAPRPRPHRSNTP